MGFPSVEGDADGTGGAVRVQLENHGHLWVASLMNRVAGLPASSIIRITAQRSPPAVAGESRRCPVNRSSASRTTRWNS